MIPVSNGTFGVSSSFTMQTGLSTAVRIPSSKKTLGFKHDMSHNTKSAFSIFLMISAWITSEPSAAGGTGVRPAFSIAGLNR